MIQHNSTVGPSDFMHYTELCDKFTMQGLLLSHENTKMHQVTSSQTARCILTPSEGRVCNYINTLSSLTKPLTTAYQQYHITYLMYTVLTQHYLNIISFVQEKSKTNQRTLHSQHLYAAVDKMVEIFDPPNFLMMEMGQILIRHERDPDP